ncbi:MAG: FHA domain-containing protein [Gammaproteobacteria bacterium]|nr:FHA domain-containing protein [Gammaproteobacteria bacterium]
MIKLKHILNGVVVSEINLAEGDFTIGRNHGNSLQLEDGVVSGEHAVIRLEPSPYLTNAFDVTIRDLDSTNGIYVNNLLVKDQRLKHGDSIKIGTHEFKVFDDQSKSGTQTEFYVPDD